MRRIVSVLAVGLLAASACSDDASPGEASTTASSTSSSTTTTATSTTTTSTTTTTEPSGPTAVAVTEEVARNMSVTIDGTEVQLRDGVAASGLAVRVTGTVVGDVTGDGVDDVAMVVFHTLPATTGHISSLVVVHDSGAGPLVTNDVHISDIARLHDVRVEDGAAHVRWSAGQTSGEQERSSYRVDDAGILSRQDAQLGLLIDGTPDGFHLGAQQGGQLPYGSSFDRVRAALTPLLGEPTDEGMSATCWGRQEYLLWDSPDGTISVSALEDEFFQWWSSDPRLVVDVVVSPGARLAWLEQVKQTEFTLTYNEIGGDFITELDPRVTIDETGELVGTVSGTWESEWQRLHTVIVDPAENPDIWCGD